METIIQVIISGRNVCLHQTTPFKNPGIITKIAITEDISDGDVMKCIKG